MSAAFIVEGDMERRIIQRLCPGASVNLIGANGDGVTLHAMAQRIYVQVSRLMNRHHPIFVIFDREGRNETATEIRNEIMNYLLCKIKDLSEIHIHVADRCTETWILPFLRDDLTISDEPIQNVGDGDAKKGMMKRKFRDRGKQYIETIDGVKLFCGLNPHRLSSHSESFAAFYASAQRYCSWMRL